MTTKSVKKLSAAEQSKDIQNNIYNKFDLENKENKNVLIEIKNVSKWFKKPFSKNIQNILEDISFNINEDEIISLIGNNGCGKTTLTEIVSGIVDPNKGEIISHLSPDEKIGVQFQDTSFPFGLTVKDIIDFQLQISRNTIDKETIQEMLKAFEMSNLINSRASKLSGGQQQRLNVLIALLSKPKVLFLDEFTTGLDIAIRNQIKEYIIYFIKKYKISLVLISHDVDIIKEIPNRYVVIADKTKKLDATKQEVVEIFGSIDNMLNYYVR